jgi:pimeloyl-ACP methyl ester carboxylesterase
MGASTSKNRAGFFLQKIEGRCMNKKRWVFFGLGIIFIAISVWQIAAAQKGLDVIHLHTNNPPVTIISPAGITPASRPTVLIAHGFAGSSVLMRGFELTLAHAGFTTISWDFEGHGTNPHPFSLSASSTDLLHDAESALSEAATTGRIDILHVAILGHSMGSGVALSYGVAHPATYATIAISPVPQPVTQSLPHNLLLMAGSLEPQFVSNAEQILAMAGGESGSLQDGTARQLVIIPDVEHISILFSRTAQSASRDWLVGTFGVQPSATNFVDHRILWFGLGIVGFLFLSFVSVNSFFITKPTSQAIHPIWYRLLALLCGGLGATLILWLVSLLGVDLSKLFGLLVGGYIILWFGVAGVISLIILHPHIPRITTRDFVLTLIAFAALWLGVGLLGNFVWLPWLLIPARLVLWIPAVVITLPWFLAFSEAAKASSPAAQIGWWLAQVLVVVGGLYLALTINPSLGFIFLILPVIPIMLGLQSLAISPRQGSWAYTLSASLFTGWLLLAVFPLI